MTVLWVAIGAFVGAPTRYLVDRAVQRRHQSAMPWGTFTVNMVASFILGFVAGATGLDPWLAALLGTGFCGALSTFSTFSYEGVQLVRRRNVALAVIYLVGSAVCGVLLAWAGWTIA